MADRKENELTKANNFEYVRALDSNGNSIQISKSDLISVLEGLIQLAGTNNKGFISASMYNMTYRSKTTNGLLKICSMGDFAALISIACFGVSSIVAISCANSGYKNTNVKVVGNTALNDSHFSMYRDEEGVYLKNTKGGTSVITILRADKEQFISLEESSKNIGDLEKLSIF